VTDAGISGRASSSKVASRSTFRSTRESRGSRQCSAAARDQLVDARDGPRRRHQLARELLAVAVARMPPARSAPKKTPSAPGAALSPSMSSL
jgi:hypothetical protein